MKNEYLDSLIQEIEQAVHSRNIEKVQIGIENILKYSKEYRNYPEVKIDFNLVGTPKIRSIHKVYELLKNLNEENLEEIWEKCSDFFEIDISSADLEFIEKKVKKLESLTNYKRKRTTKLLKILTGLELEKKHQFGGYGKKFYKDLAEILINGFKDSDSIFNILKNERSLESILSGYKRENRTK